ncbi:MAG: hypothetical protein ACJAW1_003550, partial [Glaciecola sp.]
MYITQEYGLNFSPRFNISVTDSEHVLHTNLVICLGFKFK